MATYIKQPLYIRALFKIAKTFGYNISISRNPPFKKGHHLVIYVTKEANYLETQDE